MFGYLNLADPTKIGSNEAQEAVNVKIDNGFLEYKKYDVQAAGFRKARDIDGTEIFLNNGDDTRALPAPHYDTSDATLARKLSTGYFDIVGTPGLFDMVNFIASNPPAVTDKPYVSVNTGLGSQVPPGKHEYVITIYNPVSDEESYATGIWEITTTAGQHVEFTSFPDLMDGARASRGYMSPLYCFMQKTQCEFRIYRRDPGSAEFLRVPAPTISAFMNNPLAVHYDPFPPQMLGTALPTGIYDFIINGSKWYSDTQVQPHLLFSTFTDGGVSLFCIHNDRLWVKREGEPDADTIPRKGNSVLYYSEKNKYGQFPLENFFIFNSEVMGLYSVDEALIVAGIDDLYVIYGDSPKDFVVKQITNNNEIGSAGYFSGKTVDKILYFLASDPADRKAKAKGIYAMSGGGVKRLSTPIENLFPVLPLSEMSPIFPGYKPRPSYNVGIVDDRFFVVRANFGTAGSPVLKNIVYDAAANGFCLSDASTTFTYRSKEFGRPGQWDDMKRAFVRGLGEFTIELYYDGIKEDEIDFNITGTIPQTEDFTVPGIRANYFSFRIIGKSTAKIYEFGRLE